MKHILGVLLLFVSTWAQAVTVLPDIYVTEAPNEFGGTYTVYINQPPLELSAPWYLSAWGITNQDAISVNTGLFGWTGDLFDAASWDSGIVFETYVPFPDSPIFRFESGAGGIGDFDSVFGAGYSQAAVYWVSEYYGDPGLVATSSNFEWIGGGPTSTAFAVITNSVSSESLACNIGVGSSGPLSCTVITAPVPIPAAAWLFASALGLLGWIRRRN